MEQVVLSHNQHKLGWVSWVGEDTSFAGITMGARELQHILRSRDAVLHAYNHARRIVGIHASNQLITL